MIKEVRKANNGRKSVYLVKNRVVVLVRESGKNISLTTTRNIAWEILEKIGEALITK